jgi:hypothetical protein
MTEPFVLVVGGGCAGVSAAVTLAEAGENVLLVEQRDKLGGAVYRQPASRAQGAVKLAPALSRQWWDLMVRMEKVRHRLKVHLSGIFIGIDGEERFLFDSAALKRSFACRPAAVIAALGASERIRPFEGWDLNGVMSAGGAQVLLKETGTFPIGPILVAGSGPLLLAVAAQLSRCRRRPVAVLEGGTPWRTPSALPGLFAGMPQMREAIGYGATLLRHGVPIVTDAQVLAARKTADGLSVEVQRGGSRIRYDVRHLLVHDGVFPNHVPALSEAQLKVPLVLAGDGREILGAYAAPVDGARAAHEVLKRLGRDGPAFCERKLDKARAFQKALAALFRTDPRPLRDETVICVCEQKRQADLQALDAHASSREVRLVGRFGMGPCQGRFCRRTLQSLDRDMQVSNARWPIRPVSVGSLAALDEQDISYSEL